MAKPGLAVCLYVVGFLKRKKLVSGEVLWVVHMVVLGRQSLLGAEGSRAVFCSALPSVCDESYFMDGRRPE